MNLYAKLKLLDLLKDGTVRSYRALEPDSGLTVLLHWLPAERGPEQESLFRFLDELPPEGRRLILEAGLQDGRPYIITESPIAFTGLREWLWQATAQKNLEANDRLSQKGVWKAATTEPSPSVAPEPDPLSVTRTIVYRIPTQARPPVVEVAAGSTEAAPPAAPPVQHAKPSEFTQMFQAPKEQPPAPSPAPLPKQTLEPGEFTRMFSPATLPQPTQTSPVAAPPERNEPGEFTRAFQLPTTTPQAAPPVPPVPAAPPSADMGEFTRIFAPATASPPPKASPSAPPPAPQAQPGEFTRAFQLPTPQAAPPPPPPAPPPAQTGEPGEFTRIFAPTSLQPPPSAAPRPSQQSEPGEFTRAFQMPSPQPNAPTSSPPPQTAQPGEFTRMFQMPSEPSRSEPMPSSPSQPEPGEFTRFFQSPLAAPSPPSPRDDLFNQPIASAPSPRSGEVGEFTRVFGPSSSSSDSASPPPPAFSAPQGATGVFSAPVSGPSASVPPAAEGVSEYTRLFGAPATPVPSNTAAPVAPTPPPKVVRKQTSYVPLILILTLLAVCALVLIFYLSQR